MPKFEDLTGQKFGRLTVLKYMGRNNNKKSLWLCQCECGNEKIVIAQCLKNGSTTSCGCRCIENTIKRSTKHNKTKTRLYKVWIGMKARCYNKNHKSYNHYGGRGIKICNEWLDFQNFYAWAYANGYDENAPTMKCTIDRIDSNKNYCPENCRWVDMFVQANNTNKNHYITYNNETHTPPEWENILGIPQKVILSRLYSGWSIEETLNTPNNFYKTKSNLTYNNQTKSITKWANITGIKSSTIYMRLKKGWSIEKALTTPTRKRTIFQTF